MTETNLMIKAVFWDMDGTLIDSEPYWHEGEMKIAAAHGGYWDEELAWQGSGTPVPDVARRMVVTLVFSSLFFAIGPASLSVYTYRAIRDSIRICTG